MSKVQSIYKLTHKTAEKLSAGSWQSFLQTAAWNYKYSFLNQMLIFAQHPKATACATMETWNKALQRRVKRGSSGIALLKDGLDGMELSYVFDVSDTYSPKRTVFELWSVTEEKEQAVRTALAPIYLQEIRNNEAVTMSDTEFFLAVATSAVENEAQDSIEELLSLRESNSELASFTEEEVIEQFCTLLTHSVAAIIMYRCGLEPNLKPEAFSHAALFREAEAMAILGQTTQSLSRQCLNVIARAVRSWDKEHTKEEELQHGHERELSKGRGVQDPGTERAGAAAAESVREDAQELSSEPQAESLHSTDDERRIDDASSVSREADGGTGRSGNDSASDRELGTEQGQRQPEMGTAHESAAPAGGGTGLPEDNLRITGDDEVPLPEASEYGLEVQFPSTEEQDLIIESTLAGNHLTQDEIDSILTNPSESSAPREMLAAIFRDDPSFELAETALREIFGTLVFAHTFTDGVKGDIIGTPYGLRVMRDGDISVLDWPSLANRLRYLVESGRLTPSISNEPHPMTSQALQTGEVYFINGTQYQVLGQSENVVTLQDVEHPIFTQRISRDVLDVLLQSSERGRQEYVSHSNNDNSSSSAPVSEQGITLIGNSHSYDLTSFPVGALRYALISILNDSYSHLLTGKGGSEKDSLPAEAELLVKTAEYTNESDVISGKELTAEQELQLRTPDDLGKDLIALTFRLRNESVDLGNVNFAIRILEAMYGRDEQTLYEEGKVSTWISMERSQTQNPPYTLSPAQRNYQFLEKYAPEITSGKLDYIRFEAESYEPLYIERIGSSEFAIAHTYTQNGDVMYDPEVVFHMDWERKALYPLSFEQSNLSVYQTVYSPDDSARLYPNHQLERDLNSFIGSWFQNLEQQNHIPIRGTKFDIDGDIDYSFDAERNLVLPDPESPIADVQSSQQPEKTDDFEWDHPELRRRDLSRNQRIDKVVLADLLTHFANYRVSYALKMPTLSEPDREGYLKELSVFDENVVTDDVSENLEFIQQVTDFFYRWFTPFSSKMPQHVQNELNEVLSAAEKLDGIVIQNEEEEQKATSKQADNETFEEPIFEVGDEYHDAYGGGVITNVLPPDEEGRVTGVFGYKSKENLRGFIMDLPSAVERIRSGEATLTKGNGILPEWLITPSEQEKEEREAEKEPTLFDFELVPETESKPAPQPVPVSVASQSETDIRLNYHITDKSPHYGGPKARFQNNVDAIRLLKKLESEDRLATHDEQEILSRYVGWGGLSQAFDPGNSQWNKEYSVLRDLLTEEEYRSARESTLTAFYTPPVVAEAIYNGLRRLGFRRGNILDPCCATGNFFGMLPDDMQASKLYGVELDSLSGRIGRQLYQSANILIEGYEKASMPDSIFDVAVGNVPFGNYQLADRRYDKNHFLIHDYFFAKTLDVVRPGGVIAFITSKGTMDKQNDSVRRYIARRADLLGAIRLPDNTFRDNAGTETVSDILFLRKRGRPAIEDPSWIGLDREWQEDGILGHVCNSYFVDHPEMVLGDMVEVSGPHGPVWTCKAREGEDLGDLLDGAIQNIEGEIGLVTEVDLDSDLEGLDDREIILADPDVRNFSFTVVDGDVYFREDSVMNRVHLKKTPEMRVKGLIELRDITRNLIDAQVNDASDEEITDLQGQLNKTYDAYTNKFGLINSRGNSLAFSDDSSYYLLCSLENLDKEGNFVGKADMFYKRTIGRHKEITHVETPEDALGASMGELGRIDLGYMSRISSMNEEELLQGLKGIIFPVPGQTGHYEVYNTYLSGNIREKLAEAREAAAEDPRFTVNVENLERAMPEELGPDAIGVRLGSTWVPPSDYKDFIFELLNMPEYLREYVNVIYSDYTDAWSISNQSYTTYNVKAQTEFGTKRINAYKIIEQTLNLKDVQIFDTEEDAHGNSMRVLNVNETIAAQEKQQLIKDAFREWVWKEPSRRDRLCQIYNEKFNSVVPPTYDGSMVRFHGLNPSIELDEHQKEGVARILYGGNTLLAHVVGAGKTWTMVPAAMEGKYLGLCNKSLIVVPNHLVGQWATAIYEAYPQANVLASTKKDFEPANRKKFCSRIATGDYDIVVIGHSQFERIPLSSERQKATLEEQLQDITNSIFELKAEQAERFTIKEMERAKKSIVTRIEKLQHGKKRDNVITFEELGVDRLFIDESHEYKNLFLYSKMHNVAGISQTDSQKASDLFMKCRYMDELTGGMGNIHATGTPVSNTMAEVYTTQRYLQYDVLQKLKLGSFDAWASTFGETVVSLELAPEGTGYRPRTRFAKFFNLPELLNMYKQVADIRTKDMLNLPLPKVKYEAISLKPSDHQRRLVRGLAERADKIRAGGVNNREDNMLCITNDGRKLALDQRLLDPTLPADPNRKAVACADKIYELYVDGAKEKLTQLVFCDISTPKKDGSFNVYDDLKELLIDRGIPAEEIKFIHEANTEAQKEAIFEKVRNGDVRVLMGSTGKMGTGTNVQDRLIAGHDLDCPWRPADLEQRAGRVERRGNKNEDVYMFRYVTEGTFDAYMYQLLEAKQRFISQIFTSKDPVREATDVDNATLSFSEIKALATGNPKIKDKVALEIEVSKLEMLQARHQAEQHRLDKEIRHTLPSRINHLEDLLPKYKNDLDRALEHPNRNKSGEMNPIVIKGKTYGTFKSAGDALLKAVEKITATNEWKTLGSFRGFEIRGIMRSFWGDEAKSAPRTPMVALVGEQSYETDCENAKGLGMMQRLNSILNSNIKYRIEDTANELKQVKNHLADAKLLYGKPFANEVLLAEKKERLAELDAELNIETQAREKIVTDRAVNDDIVSDYNNVDQKPSLSDMIASASQRSQAPDIPADRSSFLYAARN